MKIRIPNDVVSVSFLCETNPVKCLVLQHELLKHSVCDKFYGSDIAPNRGNSYFDVG